MGRTAHPLEIYKVLPKSNCGICGLPSCMAFAAAVLEGRKKPADCPGLDGLALPGLAVDGAPRRSLEDEQQQAIDGLKQQVVAIDLTDAAFRTGGRLVEGSVAIACLGKEFLVDSSGELLSPCHINHWIHFPLLHYLLVCRGATLANQWVSYSDLPDAGQWVQYFQHRCEEALRQLADAHRELVFELFVLFGAQPQASVGGADFSLLLSPLPKVPFLVNYWVEEEGFPSKLNILFDRSAGSNINAISINLLARGIIEMFRQLIVRHSREGKLF